MISLKNIAALVLLSTCISCSVFHMEAPSAITENLLHEKFLTKNVNQNMMYGPIPIPKKMQSSSKTFLFSPNVKISTNSQFCDILDDAVNRFYKMTFKSSIRTTSNIIKNVLMISKINIVLSITCFENNLKKKWPSEYMLENYFLNISSSQIDLTSHDVWGALCGLETLSQLIYKDGSGQNLVNQTLINDSPRFKHRGLLLDTSRHFVPKDVILTNLEAMSMAKLNVFHWHIVDDNSFPYKSRVFPEMSQQGAYSPYTHVYSQQDIADVHEFARRRGIRVIPEFDTPGHTLSWGKSIKPQILTPCFSKSKPNGQFGPMDPSKDSTFDFLSKFMSEVTDVFRDNYFHLGGDEVPFDCWRSNPDILRFMKKMSFGNDFAKLEAYYMNRLINATLANQPPNKSLKLLVWQEVIDNNVKLPSDTIVHVWKGVDSWMSEMANVTKKGYSTLLSSCWYLNYIHYGPDWVPLYRCDPENFNGTASQKKLVMGGEVCMWGEYVDSTNLISRTWPRAAVVGERLWSSADVKDEGNMRVRLEQFRCRMLKRGFNAEPPNGPNFCSEF